jgi:2-isopropylmalate synthase
MTLHTRKAKFGLSTGIDTTELTRVSRLVSTASGMVVPPNKAIVGANAFAHESGIHQHGMLRHEGTYEIMRPDTVGAGETRLVLGKHSGRAALASRLSELGYSIEGELLDRAFDRMKALADRRKHVTDADLEAIVNDDAQEGRDAFTLRDLLVGCGQGMPTATVRLRCPDGSERVHAAVGTGPVDAAFKAVNALVQVPVVLLEYAVHSVTEGIDALGQVTVRVREQDQSPKPHPQMQSKRIFHGFGADTDILVASVKAYLRALNHMFASSANGTRAWQATDAPKHDKVAVSAS